MKKYSWEDWTPDKVKEEKDNNKTKFSWDKPFEAPPEPPSLMQKVSNNLQENPIKLYEPMRDRVDTPPLKLPSLPKINIPEPKAPQPMQTIKGVNERSARARTPEQQEQLRESYPSSLAGAVQGISLGLAKKADKEFFEGKQQASPLAFGIGEMAGSLASMVTLGGNLPKIPGVTNKLVQQIANRAGVGAVMGATRAIGESEDLKGIGKETLRSATYFSVGALASAGAEKAVMPLLDKLVSKNPHLAKVAQIMLDTTKGATFAGVGTLASLPLYDKDERPSTEEIIKRAVTMGAFSMLMSAIGNKSYQGQKVGEVKSHFKTGEQLEKEGYTLFNKDKGIWVKRGPNGELLDQAYEGIKVKGVDMLKKDYVNAQQANKALYGKAISDDIIAKEVMKNNSLMTISEKSQVQPLSKTLPQPIEAPIIVPKVKPLPSVEKSLKSLQIPQLETAETIKANIRNKLTNIPEMKNFKIDLQYFAKNIGMLKKYQNLLSDIEKKGATMASLNEAMKLIDQVKKIPQIKADAKLKIAEIKAEMQEKIEDIKYNQLWKDLLTKQDKQDSKEMARIDKERKDFQSLIKNVNKELKTMPKQYKEPISELISNIDSKALRMSDKNKLKLQSTKEYFSKMKEENEYFEVNPVVAKKLERLEKLSIAEMNIDDIRKIKDVVKHLRHLAKTDKKLIYEGKSEDLGNVLKATIDHTKGKLKPTPQIRQKSKLSTSLNRAIDRGLKEGPKEFETIILQITDGNEKHPLYKWAFDTMNSGTKEAIKLRLADERYIEGYLKENNIKPKDFDKEIKFNLPDYGRATLTPKDKVNFYLHENAAENNRQGLRAGYNPEGYDYELKGLTKKDIDYVIKSMTKEEKALAELIHKMGNEEVLTDKYVGEFPSYKARLNMASNKMDGFDIAQVDNYMRIVRDKKYIDRALSRKFGGSTVEGISIVQERVSSGKPIIGEDPFKLLKRLSEDSSSYYGFAEPMRNLKMVFGNAELRRSLEERFGKGYMKNLDTAIKNFDGEKRQMSDLEGVVVAGMRNVQKSIMFNPWMWINQVSSLPLAFSEIEPKYFVNTEKIDRDKIKQYMPTLEIRRHGMNMFEAGEFTEALGETKGVIGKATDVVGGIGASGVTAFDTIAINQIIKASQAKVKATTKLEGEAYWKEVANVATRVVERTQPNYTPLHRSVVQLDAGALDRTLMPFMTVLLKIRNMYYKAGIYSQAGDKSKSKAIYKAVIASALMVAARNSLRDKTKGREVSPETFIADTMANLVAPIPGARDITQMLKGYDMESPIMSTINNIGAGLNGIVAEAKKDNTDSRVMARHIKKMVQGSAALAGIPLEQAEGIMLDILKNMDESVYIKYMAMYKKSPTIAKRPSYSTYSLYDKKFK